MRFTRRKGIDPNTATIRQYYIKLECVYTYSVRDLLHCLNVVTRDKLVVSIEEFNTGFLESTLRQQQTLDPRKACII